MTPDDKTDFRELLGGPKMRAQFESAVQTLTDVVLREQERLAVEALMRRIEEEQP